jgi:aminoglycoside 2'-N-acetyltransferase I
MMIVRVVRHAELTCGELSGLRTLFDAEYLDEFGEWGPEQPYGYAPHDVHVIASCGNETVGHIGWARRRISVGEQDVVVAGVGGVLIADAARDVRLGNGLMHAAVESMRDIGGIDFGYLGCREAVVTFYQSCGWQRVVAAERSLDRRGQPVTNPPEQPLMVFPLDASAEWPRGEVDIRGRAW